MKKRTNYFIYIVYFFLKKRENELNGSSNNNVQLTSEAQRFGTGSCLSKRARICSRNSATRSCTTSFNATVFGSAPPSAASSVAPERGRPVTMPKRPPPSGTGSGVAAGADVGTTGTPVVLATTGATGAFGAMGAVGAVGAEAVKRTAAE